MPSIKETFSERNKWINTRSSTVFPAYMNVKNDQILVFQNYWKWKSKINDISFMVTLRKFNSQIFAQKKIKVRSHNEISIKKIFKIKKFIGQLEFQILSSKNLKFPYPALMLFYRNTNGFQSAVHSAGRHINSNEKLNSVYSESNFLTIMNSNFSPFIHIFSGKDFLKSKNLIDLKFCNEKNKLIFNKKIKNIFSKPYSSKILFLKDYLSKIELKKIYDKKFYIKINFDIPNIFGRLIVGNYDKENDALFLTHTFRTHNSRKKNLIKVKNNNETAGYLPLINCEPLKLVARSYPTNANYIAKYDEMISKNNNLVSIGKKYIKTGGKGAPIFEKFVNSNEKFKILSFKNDIPDRLNVEFNYYLENSRHPTDIADGVKTYYQPLKKSHWGHGIASNDYQTYIFIANYSNNPKENNNEKIDLEIFSNSKKITKKVLIKKSTHKVLKFNNLKKLIKSNYFSWRTVPKKTNLNIYWVSFNKKGSISGDHSF